MSASSSPVKAAAPIVNVLSADIGDVQSGVLIADQSIKSGEVFK
jgi:hypothetical protein